MVSRVLVALAALIAVAHAQESSSSSTFDLRWTPNTKWEVVGGPFTRNSSPLDCFANTNLTIPFTYGFTYDSSYAGTGEANGGNYGSKSCGNSDGRVNMYSDMVFAYPRNANANPVCLRKLTDSATLSDLNKPDDTQTTFNQNYKYAITRTLKVCLYDSRFAPYNAQSTTSRTTKEIMDLENEKAELKVSYQSDTWQIYSSNWDGDLVTDGDWEDFNTWCAGHCDGEGGGGSTAPWQNPSNTLYGSPPATISPSGRDQQPFRSGACQQQSGDTCPPSTTASTCRTENTVSSEIWQTAIQGAGYVDPVEQRACGTSNELLARSASFNHAFKDANNVNTVDTWNKVTGPDVTNPVTATFARGMTQDAYLYTVTHDRLDSTIGIHEDIIKMWDQVTMFAPTITHFQGSAVGGPNYQSGKTFYLNNADLAIFKFNNANTEYNQIGFATTALDSATNRVYISNDLSSMGNIAGVQDPSNDDGLTQVAFDRTNGEALFLAQNGRFNTGNQGSGQFGEVGKHYWARVWSNYQVQIQWTCENIGATPDSTDEYPYRFYCEQLIDDWTTTPGKKYKNNANTYPTLKRQFTETLYKQWSPTYTFSATSDPVYLGQFISATNAGYSVASPVAAVNGDAARATTPSEENDMKQTTAQEDQAAGVALIGAGVVVLAVFGSLAICIGAGILGKMQAK